MGILYLSDEQGKRTAVQIPIQDWNKLIEESKTFRNSEKDKSSQKKPSDFWGAISKNTTDQLLQYVEQARRK